MLPIPSDPNFKMPAFSEEAFYNPSDNEDEDLLATGQWDDGETDEDLEDLDDEDLPEIDAP